MPRVCSKSLRYRVRLELDEMVCGYNIPSPLTSHVPETIDMIHSFNLHGGRRAYDREEGTAGDSSTYCYHQPVPTGTYSAFVALGWPSRTSRRALSTGGGYIDPVLKQPGSMPQEIALLWFMTRAKIDYFTNPVSLLAMTVEPNRYSRCGFEIMCATLKCKMLSSSKCRSPIQYPQHMPLMEETSRGFESSSCEPAQPSPAQTRIGRLISSQETGEMKRGHQ